MIEIEEVRNKTQLAEFIEFPDVLYKGNPYRVPPLHSIEKTILTDYLNPAFEFCEAKYWLVYKENRLAGRIAGIINQKANEIWNEEIMRFGWIDFYNDYEVSEALFKIVEDWAKEKGMKKIQGPMGFTDMDLEGMLVEGFHETATQAVIYNFPYYPTHMEKLGYTKDADWVQFEIKIPKEVPEKMRRLSHLIQEKYELKPLKVKKSKELIPYAKKMFETLNVSFKDLYGFVPLSERQIDFYIKQYFSIINPAFVCFVVDKHDEVVGFGISFASLSKAMMKAKGKLLPFGFIHLLMAMKRNDTVDLLLQGVKPEYQNKGIPAIFFTEMTQAFIDAGIKTAISSHALENNSSAFQMFKHYPNRQHLRRRSYAKAIQ